MNTPEWIGPVASMFTKLIYILLKQVPVSEGVSGKVPG